MLSKYILSAFLMFGFGIYASEPKHQNQDIIEKRDALNKKYISASLIQFFAEKKAMEQHRDDLVSGRTQVYNIFYGSVNLMDLTIDYMRGDLTDCKPYIQSINACLSRWESVIFDKRYQVHTPEEQKRLAKLQDTFIKFNKAAAILFDCQNASNINS